MDEAAWNSTPGEVLDSSGRGRHGTAGQDATTVIDAQRGTVGAFDGTGDYVVISPNQDFNLNRNGTISCWVKFADLELPEATHRIVGGANYHQTFLLNQYGSRLFAYWGSTGGPQATTASNTFLEGAWYHLAVTNDDGALAVYVDGSLKATGSQSSTAYDWNHALYIGGYPTTWTVNGYVDDVAIWTEALEPRLIAALAAGVSPLAVPEPSTLLLAVLGLTGLLACAYRRTQLRRIA
ncbi:MAG: LamG-like jellyroll fold domain-containing protein [Patescibacteria group bacterium]|nr:LamG-like jellyroll fold domain-containing protein [Patescibacteria group bacterium]